MAEWTCQRETADLARFCRITTAHWRTDGRHVSPPLVIARRTVARHARSSDVATATGAEVTLRSRHPGIGPPAPVARYPASQSARDTSSAYFTSAATWK